MRRLYVFDLDGTLASTASLATGRRTPSMILDADPIAGYPDWGLENPLGIDMAAVPGEIAALGHKTAIITRAPKAYASTLLGLLGLESHVVWASSQTDVATKLQDLSLSERIPISSVTYIGDSRDDRRAAERAGSQFVHVDEYEGVYEVDHSLSDVEQPQADDVSSVVHALLHFPDIERAQLQKELARLVRPGHRYCLIPYEPALPLGPSAFRFAGVPAALFTKGEHNATYFRFLRNLFPLYRTSSPHSKIMDAFYVVEFATSQRSTASALHRADPLGRLFSDIKDYRMRSGRLASGTEVELGSLRLVADVIAAHVSHLFGDLDEVAIDHVAPHGFSSAQPGQVSSWLAKWVAEACELAQEGAWVATRSVSREGRRLVPAQGHGVTADAAVLIDDQRTKGHSLRTHCETSVLPRYPTAVTWSHSRPPTPTGPPFGLAHPVSRCAWPEASACPTHEPKYPRADLSMLGPVPF